MTQTQTKEYTALVTALSPITHNEILAKDAKPGTDKKGKAKDYPEFRQFPFVVRENGKYTVKDIYCVSGNSLRGIGRQQLFRHTIEDVLDIDFDELLEGVLDKTRRRLLLATLECGGVSPKGSSAKGSLASGVYDKVLSQLPFLDLLGAVYVSHHFDGSCSIGNLVLRTKETEAFFCEHNFIPGTLTSITPLLSVNDIVTSECRFTKTQNNKDASENPTSGDVEAEKIKMIYGTTVLPAGTQFFWNSYCTSKNEGTLLAFDAMLALIAKRGGIGGMSNKGFGRASFNILNLDIYAAIKKYDDYILTHKDDIIEGIKLLAEEFNYTLADSSDKPKKASVKKDEK